MKHISTFESFLNEASVKIKAPEKVKVGETAIDGNGKKGEIIAIGTIGEDWINMKQYATDSDVPKLIRNAAKYGAVNLGAGITIVALKYRGGKTDVWTYDSDNAYVIKESINESADFSDYQKAITSHDWYYQMSDSSRVYDRGMDEISNIKKIYAGLDDSDKKKAFSVWAELYKKNYPNSDHAKSIKQDDFKGY